VSLTLGRCATVEEAAAAAKIDASYVGRVMRLSLLAPDNVDAIDDVRHQSVMTLAVLMRPVAVGWDWPSRSKAIISD
jgi:hypothetical protein